MFSATRRKQTLFYLAAVVAPVLTLLLQVEVPSLRESAFPRYLPFIPVVILTAMLVDAWAGFLASITSAFLIDYWLLPPAGHFKFGRSDVWGLILFLIVGVSICVVAALYHRNLNALRESEARFRLFMDNSPAIAWIKDAQGRYVYINKTYERNLHVRLEDYRGKTDLELWPEEIARRFRGNDLAVLESNRPMEVIEEAPSPDGSKSTRLNSKFPITHRGERFVAGIGVDITERKRAEEALLRSEKLAATGRLAASLAHEINNPLEAAMNAVYVASTIPAQAGEMLTLAERELRRAAHITQQTLGFYRHSGNHQQVTAHDVVKEVLSVYATKLQNRNITVHYRHRRSPSSPREGCPDECKQCQKYLCVSPGELRQVISNLLANGIDALSNGGAMHIRVSRFTDRVRLTMADNGCGIRNENLKRIFEPFFTTKEAYGTGLGLWVTQELVHKHNGVIKVRSSKDKGTVFRLTFPQERAEDGSLVTTPPTSSQRAA
jgi:PAS domain S-box-containing protein